MKRTRNAQPRGRNGRRDYLGAPDWLPATEGTRCFHGAGVARCKNNLILKKKNVSFIRMLLYANEWVFDDFFLFLKKKLI